MSISILIMLLIFLIITSIENVSLKRENKRLKSTVSKQEKDIIRYQHILTDITPTEGIFSPLEK